MATPEDIPIIAAIDEKTFNAGKDDAEPKEAYHRWIEKTYHRWMAKNPQVFFVLRNSANKVVGFAALLPMKKETMDRFVRGEIGMAEIPSDDIELFEAGKPLHVYIIALCIDPAYKAITKEELRSRRSRRETRRTSQMASVCYRNWACLNSALLFQTCPSFLSGLQIPGIPC